MRPSAFAALCLALSAPALAGESAPTGPVDLNRPGVLEQLQRDDPARYAAIRDVLKVSAEFPCASEALRLLEVQYDLKEVNCGAQLLTSYPAKRVLNFVLGHTPYVARVVVTARETLEPAVAHE